MSVKNYIENYEALLPESQKERLQGFLNVGAVPVTQGTDPTAEGQLEEQIREMMAQLGQGRMTMKLRLQEEGGQTNSDSYNLTMSEVIEDLKTLYEESNLLDALITNHQQLNKSIVANLEKDIKRLEARIDSMNLLADNVEGYGTASKENFADESLFEADRETFGSLFVDRDGTPISSSFNCVVDKLEGTLKLGTTSSYDRLHTSTGATLAEISIVEQVGEGFSDKDPRYIPDRAIDGRHDTFWGEVILADGVLQVPMVVNDSVTLTGGALCKLKITFPTPSTVSSFGFKPYCEFPIEIVTVAYSVDDSDYISGYPIPYDPDNPIITDKGITIDFPGVTAKSLFVIIRQTSAHKNYYTVTQEQRNDRAMWNKIAAAEKSTTLGTAWVDEDPITINPTLSQDKVDEFDIRWQQYLAEVKKAEFKADSYFYDLIASRAKPKRVQVEKYEYVLGAYEIEVRGQEYNSTGIYVSKPHSVNGNIQKVALEVEEWHPTFTLASGNNLKKKAYNSSGTLITTGEDLRRTSIEYYICSNDSDGWTPILPTTQVSVNNEMLLFPDKAIGEADLRFIADDSKDIKVYKDEFPLLPGYWELMTGNKRIKIYPPYWDPSSIYTIDYTPDESTGSVHEIDFTPPDDGSRPPKVITEYFNGEGENIVDKNCSAKLTYYPYVNRSKLATRTGNGSLTQDYSYNPVKIVLNPAEHELNSSIHRIEGATKIITSPIASYRDPSTDIVNKPLARCLNVTDYFSSDIPILNPYVKTDVIPTFEYYHIGKRVYLPETFRHDGPIDNYSDSHGNAIVKVEYEYLVSGVRVKIIMRRTYRTEATYSPKVDWYSLKFKVLV